MELYISNPTKQDFIFHYRMPAAQPEDRILRHANIPSGGQTVLGHTWDDATADHIVKQLEHYGAKDAAESYNGSLGRFNSLMYRRAGQIEVHEIEAAHEAVVDTQEKNSVAQATRAALGFDRSINNAQRGQRRSKTTSVEVVQQVEHGKRPTGNEVKFGLEVDPNGSTDANLPGV